MSVYPTAAADARCVARGCRCSYRTAVYPSDTTDAEWQVLELEAVEVMAQIRLATGRPMEHPLRPMFDGVRYVVRNGIEWAQANLASWTGISGDAHSAFDQYSVLLPIFVKVFGVDHPSTLSVRLSLARWTGSSGNPTAALQMCRELRSTAERALGDSHPATLIVRGNIALWTGAAGDPASAREQFADLLPERIRVSGPQHPSTLVLRTNCAYWTTESGEGLATEEQTALLELLEQILGASHPTTVMMQSRFAGSSNDSAHPYNALAPMVERIAGTGHPRTMMLASTADNEENR